MESNMVSDSGSLKFSEERTYLASDDSLAAVSDFVEESLGENGVSMKTIYQVNVCVEELFVNVAHYAYPGSQGNVSLKICIDEEKLSVRFTDSGIPFDPVQRSEPDITLSAEERKIGGLGIHMVRKMMDSMAYEYSDGQNILTITKNI